MSVGHLHTTKGWGETINELRHEFLLWDIHDYELPYADDSRRRGYVELSFTVNGQRRPVRCDTFETVEQNLRAIFFAVRDMRLMDQRGISHVMAQVATAFLGPGEGHAPWQGADASSAPTSCREIA